MGFLLHLLNAPIYNPFAPISEQAWILLEAVEKGQELLSGEMPVDLSIEEARFYAQFAFIIDLVIALPLFIFGTLSITMIVQIFSEKIEILTLVTTFFAIVFLVIGLILTPLVHLAFASVINLGGNASMGVIYLASGVQSLQGFDNATQQEINEAVDDFNEAAKYLRRGGESIQMMLFVLGLVPEYGILAKELIPFVGATLYLLDGLGPFVNGSYQLYTGFEQVTIALGLDDDPSIDTQGVNAIRNQEIDEELFQQGVELLQEGLDIYTDEVLPNLRDSVTEIDEVNFSNMYMALEDFDQDDIEVTIEEYREYINLYGNGLDAIERLVTRPVIDGNETEFATLIHYVHGVKDIMGAAEIIGKNSNFTGTTSYFESAYYHFAITYIDLDSPDVQHAIEKEVPFLNDTLRFLYDMSGLASSVCLFGIDAGRVFEDLDVIVDEFDENGFEDIANYTQSKQDLSDFVNQTNELSNSADWTAANITIIKNNVEEEVYGMFNEPARAFVNVFDAFELKTNAENANALANGLYHLFSSMEHLKTAKQHIENGEDAIEGSRWEEAKNEFNEAQTSINHSLNELENAKEYIGNKTKGMDQLEQTNIALNTINESLENINEKVEAIIDDPEDDNVSVLIKEINTEFTTINDQLAMVNVQ